jgi:hypothetical protein
MPAKKKASSTKTSKTATSTTAQGQGRGGGRGSRGGGSRRGQGGRSSKQTHSGSRESSPPSRTIVDEIFAVEEASSNSEVEVAASTITPCPCRGRPPAAAETLTHASPSDTCASEEHPSPSSSLKPRKKDPHPARTAGLARRSHAEVAEDRARQEREQLDGEAAEKAYEQEIKDKMAELERLRKVRVERERLTMEVVDAFSDEDDNKEVLQENEDIDMRSPSPLQPDLESEGEQQASKGSKVRLSYQ